MARTTRKKGGGLPAEAPLRGFQTLYLPIRCLPIRRLPGRANAARPALACSFRTAETTIGPSDKGTSSRTVSNTTATLPLPATAAKPHGFICYAREDFNLVKALRLHLKTIEMQYGFEFWCDERIGAGEDWEKMILAQVAQAHVFLLAMSSDFLASTFIMKCELKAITQRREIEPNTLIIPVWLRPCSRTAVFPGRQWVPAGENGEAKPIVEWPPIDQHHLRPHEYGHEAVRVAIQNEMEKFYGPAPPLFDC